MRRRLKNFINCRNGVIATEFALIAPVMMMIWLGIVELGSAHLVAQKVELAAQSAADLIAQEDSMDDTKLANIAAAIDAILAPFPASDTTRGYAITAVEADSGGATSVTWHRDGGTLAGGTGTAVGLPTGLVTSDDSVIVVTVSYSHVPWLGLYYVVSGDIALSETMYAKPRLIAVVCYDGVVTPTCPAPAP